MEFTLWYIWADGSVAAYGEDFATAKAAVAKSRQTLRRWARRPAQFQGNAGRALPVTARLVRAENLPFSETRALAEWALAL